MTAEHQDQRDQRDDPNWFKEETGEGIENNKRQRVDRVENQGVELSVEDVLQVLEDPSTGAYKNAVLYSAGETALEYLVRSVLFVKGIRTDIWQQYTGVVEEAFGEWRKQGL